MASKEKFPWALAFGALGMLVAFVGMYVVLFNARDESGWAFNLGLVMVFVPVMGVILVAGVRAFEKSGV